MKKNRVLSIILVTVMVFSMMTLNVCASADYQGHWAEKAIDFVKDNGFWTEEGNFNPDKAITRAEFSALLVRTLKTTVLDYVPPFEDVTENNPYYKEIYSAYKAGLIQGDGKEFNPNGTLTRQEAATILDRADYFINGKKTTAEVIKGRLKDYDSISDWAVQSVFNSLNSGFMKGVSAKKFDPQGTLTRAECATISQRISEMRKLDKLDFTIRDAKSGEEKNFSVMNDAVTVTQRGVSGFAVVARFDKGPGEVYFSRTTSTPTRLSGNLPWDTSALCKVIDPDGNMIAMYDFSHMDSGTERKIISLNIEKPGIYTMQVMNGRNGDKFEIGIKDPISWGIRGEKILGSSTSMPKNGYVYIQRTFKFFYVGVSNTQPVKLLDLEGNVRATSAAVSREYVKHQINTNSVSPNTVYQLQFADNFTGNVITDGFPGLISPTPEMALDLKGGWYDENNCVTQGALQRRARERAVEIAKNEDLDVVIERPSELPRDLQNPVAEAQFFGAYGIISGIGAALIRQVIDPEDPHLGFDWGYSHYNGTKKVLDHTFETCNYDLPQPSAPFAIATSLPLEINYTYGNQALINRTALSLLAFIVSMSEDSETRNSNLVSSNDPMLSMFSYDWYIEGYKAVECFLDAETRDILYQGLFAIGNKMMDYPGQGVTNQGLFHPLNNMRLYNLLDCDPAFEFLHNAFKRQVLGIINIGTMQYGFHEGHFIESGFDSSYEYMNREEWAEIYLEYRRCKNKDAEIFDKIEKVTEEALKFETYFTTPQPDTGENTKFILANAWTSRTTPTFGSGNNPGYEKLSHIFPVAALRKNVWNIVDGLGGSKTYPHIINSEDWAWRHLEEFYPAYENYYPPSQNRRGEPWPADTYDAFAEEDANYEGLVLPCYEEEEGIKLETSEVIALKHKGLYLISVFSSPHHDTWQKPYSYVGGAPTIIWTEDTGTVLASTKLSNSTSTFLGSENDVLLSSVLGKVGGKFVHSGREGMRGYESKENGCRLLWIEENKKFSISGTIPTTNVTITWTYELTDTGINITASTTGLGENDELWVQMPVAQSDDKGIVDFDGEKGTLDYVYNENGHVRFTWNNALESNYVPVSDTSGGMGRLKVKIPLNTQSVTFSIECVK